MKPKVKTQGTKSKGKSTRRPSSRRRSTKERSKRQRRYFWDCEWRRSVRDKPHAGPLAHIFISSPCFLVQENETFETVSYESEYQPVISELMQSSATMAKAIQMVRLVLSLSLFVFDHFEDMCVDISPVQNRLSFLYELHFDKQESWHLLHVLSSIPSAKTFFCQAMNVVLTVWTFTSNVQQLAHTRPELWNFKVFKLWDSCTAGKFSRFTTPS